MFGYLFPTKEVLSRAERRIFRDYFCTLCLAHRYRYGRLATLMHNYDLGVFAVILDLYGDKTEDCAECAKRVSNRREKFTARKWSDLVDYNLNLVRKKMEDDLRDRPSLRARVLHLGACGVFAACRKRNQCLHDVFDREFESFVTIESKGPWLDEILDAYEVFARNTFGALADVRSEQLDLFAALNRWVYWIDAIHDYDEDLKNGNYNPYVLRYGSNKSRFLENNVIHLIRSYEVHRQAIDSAYSRCSYSPQSRLVIENIMNHTIRNTTKAILENGDIPKRRKLL